MSPTTMLSKEPAAAGLLFTRVSETLRGAFGAVLQPVTSIVPKAASANILPNERFISDTSLSTRFVPTELFVKHIRSADRSDDDRRRSDENERQRGRGNARDAVEDLREDRAEKQPNTR